LTLLNIYTTQIITGQKEQEINETKFQETKTLRYSFADNQITEDALQISIQELNKITPKYGLSTSTCTTKAMAFNGRDPMRNKIVTNNNITEQLNTFLTT
jgi:N-methylhydantoinase B/oxoprolinase/acetone carboxylase alpha subunit